ncbi:UNC93-like protein [Drosera capensis]
MSVDSTIRDGSEGGEEEPSSFVSSLTSVSKAIVAPLSDVRLLLIIPLFAYFGLQQAFVWAEFTKKIVKPALGKYGVTGIMVVYGAFDAVSTPFYLDGSGGQHWSGKIHSYDLLNITIMLTGSWLNHLQSVICHPDSWWRFLCSSCHTDLDSGEIQDAVRKRHVKGLSEACIFGGTSVGNHFVTDALLSVHFLMALLLSTFSICEGAFAIHFTACHDNGYDFLCVAVLSFLFLTLRMERAFSTSVSTS